LSFVCTEQAPPGACIHLSKSSLATIKRISIKKQTNGNVFRRDNDTKQTEKLDLMARGSRLSDRQFDPAVCGLVILSGVGLLAREPGRGSSIDNGYD
jgi:hypothetical protein